MAARNKNRGIDNRENILKSAGRILQKKGGQNTSLADIAKAAGISKGTLYYYYSTKADLIYDVTQEHMSAITRTLMKTVEEKADQGDAAEIMLLVYETIIKAESRGRLHMYLLQEAVVGNTELKKRFQDAYHQWREMIADGLQKVLKRRKDVDILSHVFLTSLTGGLIQQLIGNKDLPLKEMSDWMISKK